MKLLKSSNKEQQQVCCPYKYTYTYVFLQMQLCALKGPSLCLYTKTVPPIYHTAEFSVKHMDLLARY